MLSFSPFSYNNLHFSKTLNIVKDQLVRGIRILCIEKGDFHD